MNITDELLMAYADGELDEALRSRIEDAISRDPKLASRVRDHQQLRTQVRDAFASVLDEPVPERLTAAANSSGSGTAAVVDLNRVQARRAGRTTSRWTWMQWGAMAASLLIGVLVGRIGLQTDEAAVVARDGQLVAAGALADALEQRLSSEEGEQQIGMSFRSADGEYCRTFLDRGELSMAGLACRGESQWRITVLSESSASRGSNYELAGSSLPASVVTAVDQTIVGEPLTIEEEVAARSERWR